MKFKAMDHCYMVNGGKILRQITNWSGELATVKQNLNAKKFEHLYLSISLYQDKSLDIWG